MARIYFQNEAQTEGVIELDDGRLLIGPLPPVDAQARDIYDDLVATGVVVEPYAPPAPLVPVAISDRQFFQQLAVMGAITQDEAIAAVATGTIPATLDGFVATLPQEQQFAARMLLKGATVFERNHPMTQLLAQGMGWTAEQLDALWTAAAVL